MKSLEALIVEVHARGFLVSGIGEWPRGGAPDANGQFHTDGWAASIVFDAKTPGPWVRGAGPVEALAAALAAAPVAPKPQDELEDLLG